MLRETHFNADTDEVIKVVEYTLGHDQISQTTIPYSSGTPGTPETVVFASDGHGSVRMLLNMAGAIATIAGMRQLFHYDAYGNAVGFNIAAAATTFLYSGEQFDPRIGQQYLRARYYDPATGRFNRLDPFFGNSQDPQSFHKYLYTHADPINGIDPTGLYPIASQMTLLGIHAVARMGITVFVTAMFASFLVATGLRMLGGALIGGAAGFLDGFLAHYDVNEGIQGAKFGAMGGAVVALAGPFAGAWFKTLPAATKIKWLRRLLFLDFLVTGHSVITAESTSQAIFRGTLGAGGGAIAARQVQIEEEIATTPWLNTAHIWLGEIKNGSPKGFHHRPGGIDPPNAQLIEYLTPYDANKPYWAKFKIFDSDTGRWLEKESTFFPDNWSEERVIREIQRVRKPPSAGRGFRGQSTEGFEIQGWWQGSQVNSAYPNIQRPQRPGG